MLRCVALQCLPLWVVVCCVLYMVVPYRLLVLVAGVLGAWCLVPGSRPCGGGLSAGAWFLVLCRVGVGGISGVVVSGSGSVGRVSRVGCSSEGV